MVARASIEGLPQLRAKFRKAGPEFDRELGQLHREMGRVWIGWVGGAQTGVGEGAGSTIRPSATKREVLLRVGHSRRSKKVRQWGQTQVMPHPGRPNILGAAEGRRWEIERRYVQGLKRVIRKLDLD